MLLDQDEPSCPDHAVWWRSAEGLRTFQSMVARELTPPGEEADGEDVPAVDARRVLGRCLVGADFVSREEMYARVRDAAAELGSELHARQVLRERFSRFTCAPQPSRPAIVYGDGDRARGELERPSPSNPHAAAYDEHIQKLRRRRPA